jgi:hypothetical protein
LGEQEDTVFSKENIFYGTVTNFSTRQWKHTVLRDGEFRMLQGFSKSSEFVSHGLGGDNTVWVATYKSQAPPKRREWDMLWRELNVLDTYDNRGTFSRNLEDFLMELLETP